MGEVDNYLARENLLNAAQNLLRQMDSASSLGVPPVCGSCYNSLEAFIARTEAEQREFEHGLGISVKVNDPDLLKFNDIPEYSGRICVVINMPFKNLGERLGIEDFRPSFVAGFPTEVINHLPARYNGQRVYYTIQGQDQTLVFVPNMEVASAFIKLYINNSISQPKDLPVVAPNL